MRLYITTADCMQNAVCFFEAAEDKSPIASSDLAVTGTDTINDVTKSVVFYKKDDSVKVNDIAVLYAHVQTVELVAVEDRDDMLVLLGTMINQYIDSENAGIIVLDPTLTVPKRYELKVTVVGNVPGKTRSGGTRRGRKKKSSEPVVHTEPETNEGSSDGVESALNQPEDDAEQGDTVVTIDDEDPPEFKPDMEAIKKNNENC